MSEIAHRRPVVWVAQAVWVEPIFRGIARYAFEQGWIVDSRMRWPGAIPPRMEPKPDGVIVFTGERTDLIPVVKSLGVPVVDIETYADHYGAPKVVGDDREVGALAARHLAMSRPAELVAIVEPEAERFVRERLAGFREEALLANIPCRVMTLAEFDPEALARDGPVGVFSGGDIAALEMLRRCLETGVPVPDRIAILGADDTELVCDLAPVPISSVNLNFEEKGRRAAELLHALMRGEPPAPAPVVVPPAGVSVRSSTTRISTGHAELDRVLRHFLENARRPVGVQELCDECGVSLRTVQHLARRLLGRSPMDVLAEYRLEVAERLEASGRYSLDGVAAYAGFGSRTALRRARRAAGRVV